MYVANPGEAMANGIGWPGVWLFEVRCAELTSGQRVGHTQRVMHALRRLLGGADRRRKLAIVVVAVAGLAAILIVGDRYIEGRRRAALLRDIVQAGGAATFSGGSGGAVDALLAIFGDRQVRRGDPRCDVLLRGSRFNDQWLADHDDLQGLPIKSLLIEETQLSPEGACRLIEAHQIDTINAPGLPLTDEHLRRAAAHSTLRFLNLNRTNLTDAALSRLQPDELLVLYVGGTQVTPAGLATLRGAPRLLALGIDGRQFTPELVDMLDTLPRLQNLVLTGPEITDAHLSRVVGMSQIKLLLLERTSVTPAAAAAFREQRSDCRLQAPQMAAVGSE